MPSFNEVLQDIAITHSHYVERYKTYEINKILKIFNEADSEILGRLGKANITKWSKTRYESIRKSLDEIGKVYNKQFMDTVTSDLKSFGGQEGLFQANKINETCKPVFEVAGVEVIAPSPAQIWAIATADPLMLDATRAIGMKAMLDGIPIARLDAVRQVLDYGYLIGDTTADIIKKLSGTPSMKSALQWTRNKVEAVVRTALTHMASESRKWVYQNNSDLIEGYQWVSTLDERTTDICQSYDGLVWIFDSKAREAGQYDLLDGEVYPPAHIRCRSTTVPLLVSWESLGISGDKIPEGSRASMNGQVPEKTTYKEWLVKQPASLQKDVLGVTRYNMMKDGEININSFYSKDGRMLTLKQLAEKGYNIK
jgi:SPP1 gp7 family putative phage head morphogenesis protein